jgi:hypothetical protein
MMPVGLDAAVLEDSNSKRQRLGSQRHSSAGYGAASYDYSAHQSAAAAAVGPAGGSVLQADDFMLDDAWPQHMHGSTAAATAPGQPYASQHQGAYMSSNSTYEGGGLQHRIWAGDDDLFDVGQQPVPAAAALGHRSNTSAGTAAYDAAAADAEEQGDDDDNDEHAEQEEGGQQQEEQLLSADFDLSR